MSDAMIVQKEETSDSNPWENVDHNDAPCLETMAAAPSLFRVEEETEERRGEKEQLPLSFNTFKPFWNIKMPRSPVSRFEAERKPHK